MNHSLPTGHPEDRGRNTRRPELAFAAMPKDKTLQRFREGVEE